MLELHVFVKAQGETVLQLVRLEFSSRIENIW